MRCKVLLPHSIQRVGGGLRWPLYCCTSRPPLSLLPSNIEAHALLNASFHPPSKTSDHCHCLCCQHHCIVPPSFPSPAFNKRIIIDCSCCRWTGQCNVMTTKMSQSGGNMLQGALPPLLGSKIPPVPWGGIPPSIAALVMRCKVLLSLSIQRIGGGLRLLLYCCSSGPPLSLLPSNIEARALLKASFCRAPAAIFSCRRPTCFLLAPAAIFSCRHSTTLLMPCSHCDLFPPNASATAAPPPSSDAAMSLLFKPCRRSCNLLLLLHCNRLL
jgi:hypothetical protein